jgi:hypothetical protein
MSKRVITFILTCFLSLALLAGCSSKTKETGAFDATTFIDECQILVPAAQFRTVSVDEFTLDFTKTVFDEFGKSGYYSEMSDAERVAAFNELGAVLRTYSYGGVDNGFIDYFDVDPNNHEITWHCFGAEYNTLWPMPGY